MDVLNYLVFQWQQSSAFSLNLQGVNLSSNSALDLENPSITAFSNNSLYSVVT